MAGSNAAMVSGTGTETDAVAALTEARERTLALVAPFSDAQLEHVHSTLMSPLVWDLGHIAAFEDLWIVHRYGGRPLLHEELADVYDAFETPRADRGDLPFLRPREAREYLSEVRERALDVLATQGTGDGVIAELIVRHEQQHNETMLQTIQLAQLQGVALDGHRNGAPAAPPGRRTPAFTGLELVEIPGGACTIGAPEAGFAYDNERPRHRTDVRGYLIGRTPITNASYLTFVEGGGYERREWWSDEGWSWKEDYDITRPQSWTADLRSEWRLHRARATAIRTDRSSTSPGSRPTPSPARTPAASRPSRNGRRRRPGTRSRQMARPHPWGDAPPVAGVHANLDQRAGGPVAAGSLPAGASPYGILGMIGDVWEWTASDFNGYPGFRPFPYREYSEVFFGSEYRVLRGGSWATRPRVATATFRNWDFPQRRQIFSGFRIARDL